MTTKISTMVKKTDKAIVTNLKPVTLATKKKKVPTRTFHPGSLA